MKRSKITILTSIGIILEYYDFVIYILLASFISRQFFPCTNYTAALFATFGIFVIGNIMRFFCSFIFGRLGDRLGRIKVYSNSLLLMSLATLLMGLIPNFAKWGLVSTILFSLCRILQMIAFGIETPGALTLLSEHTSIKHHGIYFGFLVSMHGFGITMGSFVIWIITKTLTNNEISSWGFRLPFLLGSILALIGFFIRKHLPETPVFLTEKKKSFVPITIYNRKYIKQIIVSLGVMIFPACLSIFLSILPVYLHDFYHYSFSDVYLATTLGYLWLVLFSPIFGKFSDYIDKKKLMIMSTLVMIICGFSIFSLLQLETRWALFCFIVFSQSICSIMAVCYFPLLPQAFPTTLRYTGIAISHNLSNTLATLVPLSANYIYNILNEPNYMIGLLIFFAILTAISALKFKGQYKIELMTR